MDNPVAWMVTYGGLTNIVYTQPTQVVDTHYQPLYATPPQRKWVGLTDDEINSIEFPESGTATIKDFVRIIESKLKDKNT